MRLGRFWFLEDAMKMNAARWWMVCACLMLAGCGTGGVTVESRTGGQVEVPNARARKIVKEVAPEYPADLRVKRIGGTVVVRLWVNPDGTVGKAEVRSSPSPALNPYATAAVEKWVFEPTENGDRRTLVVEVPLTFEVR